MKSLWRAQIKAVIRLEIKKTFFARRGLWIYFVAALPILLFVGYAISSASEHHRNVRIAGHGEKSLSYQDLLAVQTGMTKEQVMQILGKSPLVSHWSEPRDDGKQSIAHENYQYSDGQNRLYVGFADGRVVRLNLEEAYNLSNDATVFAGVFQFFFLRLAVFFGCLGIFMNLFRGEILDRSLHFYFLAPIRREVLMAGKFVAGLLATCAIFVTSVLLQSVAFLWHLPPGLRDHYLYQNHGLEQAAVYVLVTVLACVGYGAFFLVAGMWFRNPILPTAGILIWEAANPFLPSVLKHFSVIYYLKALCPVDIPVPPNTPPLMALFISNSDPVSPPLALLGILLVASVALYASMLQVRRMEINYTTE
jgi:hypothetical protein